MKPSRSSQVSAIAQYEASPLRHLLKHDSWPPRIALCLIADIDPYASKEHENDLARDYSVGDYYDGLVPDIELPGLCEKPAFERVALLSDDEIYCLRPSKEPDEKIVTEETRILKSAA